MRNSFSLESNKNVIDVLFSYNGRDEYARPVRLTWQDDDYQLGGVQFWYAEHRDSSLVHHYKISDVDNDFTFELSLETENLTWNLDKVTKAGKVSFQDMMGRRLQGVAL